MDELRDSAQEQVKAQEFLAALTALSRQYGIGITGDAQLFVMERDDYERIYRAGRESQVDFV